MSRRSSIRPFLFLAGGLLLVSTGLATALSPNAAAAPGCTRYAASAGDDAAAGSREAPFRTAGRLVSSLKPGEVGCLLPGTYAENVTVRNGGVAGAPIRLQSAPEGRATVRGRLWIAESANDVVFSDLLLDGRNGSLLPSPTVNGDRIAFYDNEVTNYHAASICFVLGHDTWGIAHDTVIERNRIHDCGAIPVTNYHHGVYVSNSRNARIVSNVIYDNADRGIQLYPNAQNTVIANNVVDGNGSGIIFSGADGISSNGTRVFANVITNSVVRFNVESYYPTGTPAGSNNLVTNNCIWNGKQGSVAPYEGYTVSGTIAVDPLYVNRAAKDFTLRGGSPCAGMGPAPAAPGPAPTLTSSAPPPASSPAQPGPPSADPPPATTKPTPPSADPPPATTKPTPPRRPKSRKLTAAKPASSEKPLFVRSGGLVRIRWGGAYRTRADLRHFLSSRGVGFAVWSKKHAAAAYVLRTGRIPARSR